MIEGLYGVRGPASERVRDLSLLGAVGSSARLAKDIGGSGAGHEVRGEGRSCDRGLFGGMAKARRQAPGGRKA
jgi:hypothetical protein